MKYLIPILIALCLILLLGYTRDVAKEVSDVKEGYRLLRQENAQLKADLKLNNQNAQRVIDEVREILEGKNFLPVWDMRTFLVYDVEEINERKSIFPANKKAKRNSASPNPGS